MNVHQNARLTPHSRAELVRRVVVEGQTPTAVAAAFGVTVKTVRKWVARFQTEGVKGLHDRSSREFVARIGRLASGDGWRRWTAPLMTLDPGCHSRPMLLAVTA